MEEIVGLKPGMNVADLGYGVRFISANMVDYSWQVACIKYLSESVVVSYQIKSKLYIYNTTFTNGTTNY